MLTHPSLWSLHLLFSLCGVDYLHLRGGYILILGPALTSCPLSPKSLCLLLCSGLSQEKGQSRTHRWVGSTFLCPWAFCDSQSLYRPSGRSHRSLSILLVPFLGNRVHQSLYPRLGACYPVFSMLRQHHEHSEESRARVHAAPPLPAWGGRLL